MTTPADPFTLARWRRKVAGLYAALREDASDRAAQARDFRAARDALFRDDPQSPLDAATRSGHAGIAWYPYDPAWRVTGTIVPEPAAAGFDISLESDGIVHCARVGHTHFSTPNGTASLALYWIEGYGGGLWLPFADATSGHTTYGGGRYLYDTIKGADLGVEAARIVLDFNHAYSPSCAYDPRWSCPLAPVENRLPFAVEAGERIA